MPTVGKPTALTGGDRCLGAPSMCHMINAARRNKAVVTSVRYSNLLRKSNIRWVISVPRLKSKKQREQLFVRALCEMESQQFNRVRVRTYSAPSYVCPPIRCCRASLSSPSATFTRRPRTATKMTARRGSPVMIAAQDEISLDEVERIAI